MSLPSESLKVIITSTRDFKHKYTYSMTIEIQDFNWNTQFTFNQCKEFHKKLVGTYTSLNIPDLPSKDSCKKTTVELEDYFRTIFLWKSIRFNLSLLHIIGIQSAVTRDENEKKEIVASEYRFPLREIDLNFRENIGKLYYYLSRSWYGSGEISRYFPNIDENYLENINDSRVHLKYAEDVKKSLYDELNIDNFINIKECIEKVDNIDEVLKVIRNLPLDILWAVLWQISLQSFLKGRMDARVHVTIQQCAILLNIPLEELAKAEGECAECLQKQLIEMEHIKMNTKSKHRKKKIAIGAAIGGGAMLIAGLITLPLLLPFITLGVGVTAGAAALLPLVGGMVSTGLVMAGGLLVAGAQIIPLIFAIGGAGLIGYKVAHITEGIKEFRFIEVPTKKMGDDDDDDEDKPEEKYFIDLEKQIIYDKEGNVLEIPKNVEEQTIIDSLKQSIDLLLSEASKIDSADIKVIKYSKDNKKAKMVGIDQLNSEKREENKIEIIEKKEEKEEQKQQTTWVKTTSNSPARRPKIQTTPHRSSPALLGDHSNNNNNISFHPPPNDFAPPLPSPLVAPSSPSSSNSPLNSSSDNNLLLGSNNNNNKNNNNNNNNISVERKSSITSIEIKDEYENKNNGNINLKSSNNSVNRSRGGSRSNSPNLFSSPSSPAIFGNNNNNNNNNEKEEVEIDFTEEEKNRIDNAGMQVFICVNGWVWKESETFRNWNTIHHLNPSAEVYSLQWESEDLQALGWFIATFITTTALSTTLKFIIVTLSVTASAFFAAIAAPLYILLAAKFVNNPWTVCSNHARRAGKLLAEVIKNSPYGKRPVTLIGWSHGARLIYYAMKYLVKDNREDYRGLIENVYLLGAPISCKPEKWKQIRPLVAGRMVNVFSKKDWLLPLLYRAACGKVKNPAGMDAVEADGIENLDVSDIVGGHLNYNSRLKDILARLDLETSVPSSFAYRVHGGDSFDQNISAEIMGLNQSTTGKLKEQYLIMKEKKNKKKEQAKVEKAILKEKEKDEKKKKDEK